SQYYLAENSGTAESPSFEAPEASPFGIPLPVVGSQVPEFADLDADGDLDLMLGVDYNGVFYYQNLRNNIIPSSEDAAVNGLINEPYYFDYTDFPFSDIDGDFLQGVRITRLPDVGTLSLNDVPLTENALVPVAELMNMAFTPETDGLGTPYADFDFQVTDGTEFNCTNFTMSINILLTGLDEVEANALWQVHPNPASTFLNVQGRLSAGTTSAQIRVLDSQGRSIQSRVEQITDGRLEIEVPVALLPAGLYWIEISSGSDYSTVKFIKK
ncbi:MAG: T9SS type A sorting domain-containing protein, partial [Phaeodactylibacter sp.]|nr:T9SS type A sorting domain-containing protein [Phaeodactylibacter sp.]